MPTLFRFFGVITILGMLGFGVMLALALFVTPEQREMSVPIPPSKFTR